jgi:hypothetical protein
MVISSLLPRREPWRGWFITTRSEKNIWTRPGTEDFLVRQKAEGGLAKEKHFLFAGNLDPDG